MTTKVKKQFLDFISKNLDKISDCENSSINIHINFYTTKNWRCGLIEFNNKNFEDLDIIKY